MIANTDITGYEFTITILGILVYLVSCIFLLIIMSGMLLAILDKIGIKNVGNGTSFICILISICCIVSLTVYFISII
jgi:hypothetical protein